MAVEAGNGSVTIQTAYYRPSADNQEFPAYIDIEIKVGNHTSIHSLSIEEFDVKGIQKHFPLLRFQKTKDRADFDEALVNELTNGLTNGSIKSGYYFEKQGAINFPDGKIGFLRGSKLLGECDRPYKVAPEISDIKLPGRRNSLRQLVDLLKTSPLQVLLVFSFIILSSVRSLLIRIY